MFAVSLCEYHMGSRIPVVWRNEDESESDTAANYARFPVNVNDFIFRVTANIEDTFVDKLY